MTAADLMVCAGVLLLAHELNPAPRLLLGATVGLWGVIAQVLF